jgi:hypothetical protein
VGKSVMVRVGGGWETLRELLRPLDPCRKDAAMLRFRALYENLQRSLEADIGRGANLDGHPALFTTRPIITA